MDDVETGERIRAARELRGIRSADDLAERIGEDGLKARTIRNTEAGRRHAQRRDLRTIAEVCEVPYEWFTVPDLAEAVRLGAAAISERGEDGEEPGASDLRPRPTPKRPPGGRQQTG